MNHYLNTQIATALHHERIATANRRAEVLRNSSESTSRSRILPGTRWTWFARRPRTLGFAAA